MLPIGHLGKGCDEIVGEGLSSVELGFSPLLLTSRIKIKFCTRQATQLTTDYDPLQNIFDTVDTFIIILEKLTLLILCETRGV